MKDIAKNVLIHASKGDMKAFEMIYEATSGFVYNIALRITNNPEDAGDVTQDVFMKIYRNLGQFRRQSSFKTWVYRITVNTAINTWRERAREADRRDDDSSLIDQYASRAEPAIDKHDHEKLIISLLELLNPDQRACIVLREIEGLNYKEISEALKININTVRSRLKRARETLLAFKGREVMKHEM
ncbi:MAG: RNA polymerase sigma factor [bacterium]